MRIASCKMFLDYNLFQPLLHLKEKQLEPDGIVLYNTSLFLYNTCSIKLLLSKGYSTRW